ncbi:hypothetical protein [Paraburkholderia atlantica]|uniref:hypothetical protein n=1 Tax=Paraburkholderia atlantica TaxID=2654982 RepID=UPI003D232BB9
MSDTKPTMPRRGDFGWQPLVSAFEPTIEDMMSIRYSAFGDEWEFIPDPKGRLVGLGTLKNPQVDGRWRRVGDTREPDVWFAWGEAAPEHGDRPVNRLPDLGTRVGVNFRKY